jgi:hypothetical protein
MKQKKEPLWREQFGRPQSLHGRFRQRADIPIDLRRWLVVHGNRHSDRLVPDILEQAMLLHFGCMYRPRAYAGHPGRDYLNNPSQFDKFRSAPRSLYPSISRFLD